MSYIKNMMGDGLLINPKSHLGKNELAQFGVPRYFPLFLNSLPHPVFAQHHLETLSALPSRRIPFEYLIVLLGMGGEAAINPSCLLFPTVSSACPDIWLSSPWDDKGRDLEK